MTEEQETQTWTERVELAGSELVEKVKQLIDEGNVRRLIIRDQNDKVIVEIPLTAGVAGVALMTWLTPVLAALGAMAALLAKVKVDIVRVEDEEEEEAEAEEKEKAS